MFYLIQQAYSLIDEDYDLIIRMRPDSIFSNKVEVTLLENMVVPYFEEEWIDDCFAIMTPETAKIYCAVYSQLNELYYLNNQQLHPEMILRTQMNCHNIRPKKLEVKHGVLRSNNTVSGHFQHCKLDQFIGM